jgi:hypothetical protein
MIDLCSDIEDCADVYYLVLSKSIHQCLKYIFQIRHQFSTSFLFQCSKCTTQNSRKKKEMLHVGADSREKGRDSNNLVTFLNEMSLPGLMSFTIYTCMPPLVPFCCCLKFFSEAENKQEFT